MRNVIEVLRYVTSFGFAGLGIVAVRRWGRSKEPAAGALAVAVGGLGLTSILGRLNHLSGYRHYSVVVLSFLAFIISGVGLLLVRDALKPYGAVARKVAWTGVAAASVVSVTIRFPNGPSPEFTPLQFSGIVLVIAVWSACVGEPAYRFWRLARGRSAVQRGRLRALSLGYGGIVALLVASLVMAPDAPIRPGQMLAIQFLSLGLLPVMWFSFTPPAWLRRLFRVSEVQAFGAAVEELLFAESSHGAAGDAVLWARRLVGGDGAVLIDHTGVVAASIGLPDASTASVAEVALRCDGARVAPIRGGGRAVVVPLRTGAGTGRLAVTSGPFTPMMGDEELSILERYSVSVAAALDRRALLEEAVERESLLATALERERQAVAELRASDEMKNEFLSAASHEMRTPLTSVVGFARTLASSGDRLDAADRELFMTRLLANAEKLERLVNDILDLDQLRLGILDARREPTDLVGLVEQVLADVAMDDGRPVTVEIAPLVATVDAAKVERIIENLVRNAVRHTAEGTPVWVAVQAVPGGVDLVVADAGPGVPPELRERIFEPFQQGTTPRHQPGVGVGLSIVARFAQLHGGGATVEERPGGGALFRVHLPCVTTPAAASPPASDRPLRAAAGGSGIYS